MGNRGSVNAGVMISFLFFAILQVCYLLFASVDIVYMKGDEILCRQDNVCFFSVIEDPIENMDDETYAENKDIQLWYLDSGEDFVYGKSMFALRLRIAGKAYSNLFSFRWSESSKPIVIMASE